MNYLPAAVFCAVGGAMVWYHDFWWVLLPANALGVNLVWVTLAQYSREEQARSALPPGTPVTRWRRSSPSGDGAVVDTSRPGPIPLPYPTAHLAPRHVGAVRTVGFVPDGRLLAVGGDDGVALWDITDPAGPVPAATLDRGAGTTVVSVAFSPDGQLLAAASDNQTAPTVALWQRRDDQTRPVRVATIDGPRHRRDTTGGLTRFSPDGGILVVMDRDAVLWDVTDPARPVPTATLPMPRRGRGHGGCAVGPCGGKRMLALAARTTVTLWDISDPTRPSRLGAIRPHGRAFAPASITVHAVDFSPDGRLLATASEQVVEGDYVTGYTSTVVLWDLHDAAHPTRIVTLARPPAFGVAAHGATLVGNPGTMRSVRFSPDGHLLATAGRGDTVWLWDVTDPTRPRPTTTLTHSAEVSTLAFSPDGRLLATGSDNGDTALWTLDTSATRASA